VNESHASFTCPTTENMDLPQTHLTKGRHITKPVDGKTLNLSLQPNCSENPYWFVE